DVIRLVGHTDDMAAAYAWADAVISPSVRPEAFGRVAVEAGAMGKPVVATAHGGAQETIINRETGLLAPPGDASALADALVDLYTRKTGGDVRMGEKARARISSLYSRAAMCEATLRVYDELLREKEKNALC
ncbi:MAG: glycosyltransferase, partial [Pseudomonadota bacterium]